MYAVIQITYPVPHQMLIRKFDSLADADDYAFGLNQNRTSSKVEYVTAFVDDNDNFVKEGGV